jgi:hypothetical protein
MRTDIPYVIAELVNHRRSSIAATKHFADLKHNTVLCPRLEEQLNRVRDSFLKYESVAYDIQGVHDQGTDVVLRYETSDADGNAQARFLAFQIKAESDLQNKGYLKTLRSQVLQAFGEYQDKLDRYYVILCVDAKEWRDEIREINKALSRHRQVTVVSPQYAFTLIRLSGTRIASLVDGFLREDDEVLKAAKLGVASLPPTQVAVLIAATYEATFGQHAANIDLGRVFANTFVRKVFDAAPDYPVSTWEDLDYDETYGPDDDDPEVELVDRRRPYVERFAEAVDLSVDSGLRTHGELGSAEVNMADVRPLQALLLDANIRYGFGNDALTTYVFGLLGIMEAFGLPGIDDEEAPVAT